MHFVSARRDHRLLAVGSALIALAFVAVLALAGRAQAAETIYWDNFGNEGPTNVAFANLDGSGGGIVDSSGRVIAAPEGMAYDTVTNRLFVANEGTATGEITAIDLGSGGASAFTAPGAPIDEPEGIAVDPATRTIYWENSGGGGSIAWANLDGSAGGTLNTAGVTLNSPCCRIALDPVAGRVYFFNSGKIAFVNTNNSGGGELNLTGSTVVPGGEGMVVDDAAGRLYFLGGNGKIGFANLNGSGGSDVPVGSAVFNTPWGLALDPSSGHLYWGNENNVEERANAIGTVSTTGGSGGGINIATAPVNHPQDPVILKSPIAEAAPSATRDPKDQSKLNCSTGSWAADYAGSFVYQAPRTLSYQWTRNGEPIAGATASTYVAKSAGRYGCTVTAVNQTGSASQASLTLNIKAAKLKLTTKKKAHAKAGGVAKFKIKALNQGDIVSGKAKVCAKLPKSAKGALKAPKCASLGKLKGRAKKSAVLKIKTLPSAGGTYTVKFQAKGAPGKAVKAKIVVG